MSKVRNIKSREILDSRGIPTIEVDVVLSSGATGRFAVPSGASTGEREALELRDGEASRYAGKGVRQAIRNIQEVLSPAIVGMESCNQEAVDQAMIALDGTEYKSRLGANALLGVSVAVAKAVANDRRKPLFTFLGEKDVYELPVPLLNVLNGGAHADNNLDIQEFMIVPIGASSFSEAIQFGAEVFYCLKDKLKQCSLGTTVGDEGGFAPDLKNNRQACEFLVNAIRMAGFREGQDIALALDVAASELYRKDQSTYLLEGQSKDAHAMIEYFKDLCGEFPIVSIEDPLDENDWTGFKLLTNELGDQVQIVGDDLFVTKAELIARGIENKSANAVLIKLNQVGTLTETLQAIQIAQNSSFGVIISHRSGETEDTTIADLSVATGAAQIKSGSLSRSERVAKYNQLLRIEEELGKQARYVGRSALGCLKRLEQ